MRIRPTCELEIRASTLEIAAMEINIHTVSEDENILVTDYSPEFPEKLGKPRESDQHVYDRCMQTLENTSFDFGNGVDEFQFTNSGNETAMDCSNEYQVNGDQS